MEKTREQISTIRKYIQRSIAQGKPYAYEVTLVTANNRTELVSRIQGLDNFSDDISQALGTAQSSGGDLEVKVYRSMSHNARLANTYTIVCGNNESTEDLRSVVREMLGEMIPKPQAQPPVNNLGSLDMLISSMTNSDGAGGKEGIAGLIGLATQAATEKNNLAIEKSQNELTLFKKDSKYALLNEKHSILSMKYKRLLNNYRANKEEKETLKKEIIDLEERLKGYAPNEMMKRVGIGVLGQIGTKMLASPKIAEALNLSPEQLKGALGLVDEEDASPVSQMESAPVSITAVDEMLSPEEQQKKEMMDNITATLKGFDLASVGKIYHVFSIALLTQDILDGFYQRAQSIEKMLEDQKSQPVVKEPELNMAALEGDDAPDYDDVEMSDE